jgi:four helix bundle protein
MVMSVAANGRRSLWRRFCHVFCGHRGKRPDYRSGADLECARRMGSRIISERAFAFACRIVALCETLWARGPAAKRLADQLFDAGTSIGANAEEAEGAQTKPDFIAKLAISRKESRETVYWLRLSIATGLTTKDQVAWELDEASQLRSMITQAIRTAQASSWRGGV